MSEETKKTWQGSFFTTEELKEFEELGKGLGLEVWDFIAKVTEALKKRGTR